MFAADAGRTCFTAEELPTSVALYWTYRAAHAPMPAWPRSDRQPFDRACQTVVARGTLYFGCSADGKVYALDAATGKERWTFFTGGPVRFAPAVWKDRLFVAGDDGFLHCLAADDGKVLWQRRGGPNGRTILGNDRLVSHWPARGGPVIVDDVVYFAAGIWPSDGIYLYALDAATGKVLWLNDKSGDLYMGQPHGGANANSGVSAQGYLVAAGDRLLVPTGRAVPAVFGQSDGKFQYFHLQLNGHKGGTTTLATGTGFLNGGLLFDTATGAAIETAGPGASAAFPDGVLLTTATTVTVSGFVNKEKRDRKGEPIKYRGLEKQWTLSVPGGTAAMVAGKTAIVAGAGQVSAINMTSRKVVWSVKVEGTVHGLAAANGRLYFSTDKGLIYCFAAPGSEKPAVVKHDPQVSPYGENAVAAAAA